MQSIANVLKYNPYHDKLGRFAKANSPQDHNFVSTGGIFAKQNSTFIPPTESSGKSTIQI